MFETVQIEEKHGDFFHVTRRENDRLIHAVVEEHAIGQAGQKVMLSGVSHLQRHGAGGTYVAEDDYCSGGFSFAVVDGGNRIFNGNFKTVAPDENTVGWQVHGPILPNRLLHRTWGGYAAGGIQDLKNFSHGPVGGLFQCPT